MLTKNKFKIVTAPIQFLTSKKKFPLPTTKAVKAGYSELLKEGFPTKVSKAFQKAADELNCVIWSRVPGKACTTLIDEGYNLKPFYVHGKSCNWGPMAGFVCQLPALNKSGASKMDYNLKEHLNSLKWLEEIRKREREQDKVADSLFLPLSISDKRKNELTNSEDFLGKEGVDYHQIDNGLVVGIAQDKNKTVAVEYLIKKRTDNSKLWDVYHRNIYIHEVEDKYYFNYLKERSDSFFVPPNPVHTSLDNVTKYNQSIEKSIDSNSIKNPDDLGDPDEINKSLKSLLDNLVQSTIVMSPSGTQPLEKFYPINGIQSPYLAYRDEANLYKNAVSGDYDLFAVWPFTPNASFEMTTRISERASKPSESDKIQRLFIPVEAKENAVEITKSRNVFIEFIGTYKELDGKEDRELGNINDLVSLAAQTLNSLIRATYLGKNAKDKGQFPNRAFHSDEGGRPGVDEIEYPIAFFMPKSKPLWNDLKQEESRLIKDGLIKEEGILKSTAFVVENHVEFLSLVQLLRRQFYVFLHDGWFMHWMCLAAGKLAITEKTGNVTLPDKPRRYLKAREKEIDDLGDVSQQSIESLLREILAPTPATATALERNAASRAFQGVAENFLELAAYQQSPDVAERKDLISPLEIKIPE